MPKTNPPVFASPFCEQVYNLARDHPLSFNEIEIRAGVSHAFFSYLRSGRTPTLATLEPVLTVLGVRLTLTKD